MVIAAQNTHQKPGYKQTGVGVIPEDWEVANLKRFWTVIDCKHLTAKFVENGIPLASIREVQGRFVELENAKQTTQLYYLALIEGGRKPQPGDLIFSRNATVGEIALVAEWHPPFAMGQDVCLLRKKHPDFSSGYLQAVIRSPMVLKQFANFMVGSTFKRVNVKQIQNLMVSMPLPEEQTAIADILSDLNSLMESLDKLIAKKRDIKQATMQQLLTGKTRLPEFNKGLKRPYKQTEIGEIPEDWEIHPLKDHIAHLEGGISVNSVDEEHADEQAILKTSAVLNGYFLPYENKKIAPRDIKRAKLNPRADSIIISRMNTPDLVGECGYVDKDYPNLFLPDRLWMTRIKRESKINVKWLSYVLSYRKYKAKIKEAATGTSGSMKNIAKISLLAINIPVPLPEEQQAIATILSDMDAEIAALEQKRDKTRTLKQGMMQELLTGKTRLL